jgi:hypothetical protein
MTDTRFQRYAIYWTPAVGTPFAEFGEAWLGGFDTFGLPAELAARGAKSPASYGLHATLKAPFRLREDASVKALQAALDEFCDSGRPLHAAPLKFGRYQRHLTLMLDGNEAEIDRLAGDCVTRFDRVRAPLSEEDRRRREVGEMTPRQAAYLEEFGYPYILDDFCFHISLAGPLEEAEIDAVEAALAMRLAPLMAAQFQIGDLTLLGEPRDGGAFETISRHLFNG